jgi:hypothetical protein
MYGWRSFGVVILVLAQLTVAVAHAQTPEPRAKAAPTPRSLGPRLEWRAPASCPTREEVRALVATLAENDRLSWDRFEVIRAQVERQGSGWSLALEFVAAGGVRRRALQSRRCVELAEAAAVAIVLAHRSSEGEALGASQTTGSGDAEGDLSRPPNPLAASPGAASRVAAPIPTPTTPDAEERGAQGGSANSDHSPEVTLGAAAEVALDPATLGSAAFGAGVGLELGRGEVTAALYGAGFPSAATRVGAGQSIALGLWTGGLRGCYRWGRGLDTCASMEVGALTAEGIGLIQAGRSHDLWAAPGLGASFRSAPFDGFGITTRVTAFHPLVRGSYRVDESEVVHRVPAIGFRATLGIDLPLL